MFIYSVSRNEPPNCTLLDKSLLCKFFFWSFAIIPPVSQKLLLLLIKSAFITEQQPIILLKTQNWFTTGSENLFGQQSSPVNTLCATNYKIISIVCSLLLPQLQLVCARAYFQTVFQGGLFQFHDATPSLCGQSALLWYWYAVRWWAAQVCAKDSQWHLNPGCCLASPDVLSLFLQVGFNLRCKKPFGSWK